MNKAKLTKLGKKLVLVVNEAALFELSYRIGDKSEDYKTEVKTWDMCTEQEQNVIFATAIREHVKEQEQLLDEVFQSEGEPNEDRETVSEDTSTDEK